LFNIRLSKSFFAHSRLWNIETRDELRDAQGHGDVVLAVAMSLDGNFFVTGSADRDV
jgi:WD40 repeat protein